MDTPYITIYEAIGIDFAAAPSEALTGLITEAKKQIKRSTLFGPRRDFLLAELAYAHSHRLKEIAEQERRELWDQTFAYLSRSKVAA